MNLDLSAIPSLPGIYRFFDNQNILIYVGKAKSLRRRLSQYKNAKRRKKHRKMRKILEQSAKLDIEVCQSDLEAQILEAQIIQSHRPKWNVAGAFYFLYPMVGMKEEDGMTSFIYTTQPEYFSKDCFEFHGAFRSREMTLEAYFSLMEILKYIGHSVPKKRTAKLLIPKFSYVYEFRQLPDRWGPLWCDFWQGRSRQLLEEIVLELLENAGARHRSQEIQELIRKLMRFWKHEASRLWEVRKKTNSSEYPVSQKNRDILFLKYRGTLRIK